MTGAPPQLLVLGYGNTLRRDDGVGVKAAEKLAGLELPGVEVMTRHQLLPEMAEKVSQFEVVVFIDAAVRAGALTTLMPLEPAAVSQLMAHATDPRSLLAMSRELYGYHPTGFARAIPGEDFGFGDGLSPRAEQGMQAAINLLREFALHLPKINHSPMPARAA
ncbi:MAG TPA: hydrogenase maturation protease [Verrucomicrobiae bacterium]|nr:hydrogenase maturation protease [Verrucomicrobiae bacterium]